MKAIPERKVTTNLLVAALAAVGVNQTITKAELCEAAHCDIRLPKNRGYLESARKIMKREHGIVFSAVRSVGLKRCDDSGIAARGVEAVQSIHRKSYRARKETELANLANLKPEERTRLFATSAVLGAIETGSRQSTVKKLEAKAVKTQAHLPLEETLKEFA